MTPRFTDMPLEAERVWVASLRALPPERKWRQVWEFHAWGRELHGMGVRDRNPNATAKDVLDAWNRATMGDLARLVTLGGTEVFLPLDAQAVLRQVLGVFQALGIRHAISGSIASSLHGIPRFTADADLVTDPFPGREPEFVAGFGPDYYISLDAVQEANRRRASFNIIHPISGFKVDVYIVGDRPYDRVVLSREVPFVAPNQPDQPIPLLSPEDVLLAKLEWYRLGGEVSDRQWSDVKGVLVARSGRLDDAYLDHWARELGLTELLERARSESVTP